MNEGPGKEMGMLGWGQMALKGIESHAELNSGPLKGVQGGNQTFEYTF